MSTTAIVMNIILTELALVAFAIGVLIACRLRDPDDEGRADWRDPRGSALPLAATR